MCVMKISQTRSFGNTAREKSTVCRTFRALQHRQFRRLWVGLGISAIGTWMQIVALSLLVLRMMRGSAFALGSVSLVQASAFFLFALLGGGLADRIEKRKLLIFTQSASAGLSVVLGVLTWAGVIQLWMILVISFLNGTVLSFDQPARNALIPQLVPDTDLVNATSLQTTLFNGVSVIGPVLGGLAVRLMGFAGNFFLNAASFVAVLTALYAMRLPAQPVNSRSILTGIREALATVRRDAVLPWVLTGYGSLLFFGPSPALMLPFYSMRVLHLGPARLGLLFSSVGLGSIVGGLIVASLKGDAPKGRLYLAGILTWVISLASFGVSRWPWVSMVALLFLGVGQTFAATTTITLLQTRVRNQMRGRVMSLNTLLLMGVRPLGDFPVGASISLIGAPATVSVSAALVGVYGAITFITRPSVRSA